MGGRVASSEGRKDSLRGFHLSPINGQYLAVWGMLDLYEDASIYHVHESERLMHPALGGGVHCNQAKLLQNIRAPLFLGGLGRVSYMPLQRGVLECVTHRCLIYSLRPIAGPLFSFTHRGLFMSLHT